MGAVTTSLETRARSIFDELGYDVSRRGTELCAERAWRVVRVTTSTPERVPDDGQYRCFVARATEADRTRRRVVSADPDYEWAVIAVDEDGDYDVVDATTTA